MPAAGIITTTATMTTTTDQTALLNLLAWLSPAFPTGAFAYSHGIEWAVEAADIKNGDDLTNWLTDVVAHGSGRSDTILLRHAHRAATDPAVLGDIADLAAACAATRERRDEALNQGRAFQLAVAPWTATSAPEHATYAVAVGAAAGEQGIPENDTALAFLQAFATNLISPRCASCRWDRPPACASSPRSSQLFLPPAEATKTATLDDLAAAPSGPISAAMRHETQYTRLFRS